MNLEVPRKERLISGYDCWLLSENRGEKSTLVNLLNDDIDDVDEIIEGTIVKKADDMERMEETPKWK